MKKNFKNGFSAIVILVIVLVIVLGIGGYFYYFERTSQNTEQQSGNQNIESVVNQLQNINTSKVSDNNVPVTVNTTSTVVSKLAITDCGISTEESGSLEVKGNLGGEINTSSTANFSGNSNTALKCIQDNFERCQPAKYSATSFFGTVNYEIISPKNNLCTVKWYYSKNPNPAWENKNISCDYDNTQNFSDTFKDLSHCSGPLYNLMTGK